jgi:protein-S-isoprenylcysteine O-methyltransferase Ste14
MSVTQDADADQRWAAAQTIADGAMDDRMPRRRRTVWLWVSALIIVSWLLGFALALILPRSATVPDGDDAGVSTRLIVGLLFQGSGLLIAIVGFIWAIRTNRYITRWRAVVSPLNRRERKWVLRQIRSGTPVEDERKKTVVLAAAAQNRRAVQGLLPLYFGLTLMFLGTGLLSRLAVVLWLELAAVLAFIILLAVLGRDYRRAGTYLERFGDTPGQNRSGDTGP